MNILVPLLIGWLLMAVVMALLWEVQRRRKNAGIVDVAWTVGVGLLGIFFALWANGLGTRRVLIAAMATLWAIRLARHLVERISRESEDGRYHQLREKWGEKTQINLFWFFQLQAFWSVLFAFPMLIAAGNTTGALQVWDLLGILIWLVSVVGESVADRQLARFRSNPQNRGQVCSRGLWRYSRHPNYFFEWIHWWAYVLIAIGSPLGWLTLAGPVLMLLFLFKITGIPPTEAQALRSRGEAYRQYQRTTSVFFPWPPKARQ